MERTKAEVEVGEPCKVREWKWAYRDVKTFRIPRRAAFWRGDIYRGPQREQKEALIRVLITAHT